MPSKKKGIMVRPNDEIYIKIEKLAEEENRSMSNLIEYIVKKYIENYEKDHGTINVTLESSNNNNINIGR